MFKSLSPLWTVLLRTVLPSVLGGLGAVAAALYSDGFRVFCGFQ